MTARKPVAPSYGRQRALLAGPSRRMDGVPQAQYVNYFKVGQNAVEFVIDFGQQYGTDPSPLLHTRVVTSPLYAKALWEVLGNSIEDYEAANGPIPMEAPAHD
jgi:hypothetical protein